MVKKNLKYNLNKILNRMDGFYDNGSASTCLSNIFFFKSFNYFKNKQVVIINV